METNNNTVITEITPNECETICGTDCYAGCKGNECIGCICNPNNSY